MAKTLENRVEKIEARSAPRPLDHLTLAELHAIRDELLGLPDDAPLPEHLAALAQRILPTGKRTQPRETPSESASQSWSSGPSFTPTR